MLFDRIFAFLLFAGVAFTGPVQKRDVSFNFGSQTTRGLNIGGWLVLEPFITPSIFDPLPASVVDEYTLCQTVPNANAILKSHWDTWVTLADFQKIAGAGFNTVRIPIGYWAFRKYPGDTYIQGAAPYLDAAIGWARQTGLKVWIDLHGAPLSQNGFDNSGHRVASPLWTTGNSVDFTLGVLNQITQKYAQPAYQDVVVAIELLNEPLISALPGGDSAVRQFYRDGFNQVRAVSNTPVILQDGFTSASAWNGFLTPSDNNAQNVVIDHHEYQVFDPYLVTLPPWAHRQQVCNSAASWAGNRDHWLVVGEWTSTFTDCAKYLNGRGRGARYDGSLPGSTRVAACPTSGDNSGQISTWTQTFRDDVRGFIEAQLEVYEVHAQGWIYWNFKTETAGDWNAFGLLDAGIFPQPLTARKFGAICSN